MRWTYVKILTQVRGGRYIGGLLKTSWNTNEGWQGDDADNKNYVSERRVWAAGGSGVIRHTPTTDARRSDISICWLPQ